MGTQKEGGLVSRAVREALGTLVSPQVSTQLIERALTDARLTAIPEAGQAIARWIEGPLRAQVEAAVGADAAELVAAQLAPIVAHAAQAPESRPGAQTAFGSDKPTGVMASTARAAPDRDDTARRQLSDEELRTLGSAPLHTRRPQSFELERVVVPRRVLTATTAGEAVEVLARYLGDTARVEQVLDLVGLLDALDEPAASEPIVLLDCRRPTVHVSSVSAIGEDLPHGTTIMLWGPSEATWRDLDRDRVPGCRWLRCSHEATAEDVASLCAALIG